MPIQCAIPIKAGSEAEFHCLAEVATGHAFQIHNEFGRFFDEELYKAELGYRLAQAGFKAEREVRFALSHGDYRKEYAADLVINRAVIIEAKTTERIAPAHKAQGVNYLHLAGTRHGLLLNFRPRRVDRWFLSTKLDALARKCGGFVINQWMPKSHLCPQVHVRLRDLVDDWGCFLETAVYRDALFHLLGVLEQPVTLFAGQREIGTHKFHLLDSHTAIVVTAATKDHQLMQRHLVRLLAPTHLRAMQWINFNRNSVEMTTLNRSS